ncbi:MAG: CoA-acylating methylmalonate-semialdehyde dehydrogenase [Microthrixaceae bacterium]
MRIITHYVDGELTPGTSELSAPVFDPATGVQQAQVVLASIADVDAVVQSSVLALDSWRRSSLSTRASIMFKFRALMDASRHELAQLISSEHGKVPSDALGEIARGMENVEFSCGIPALLKGEYSEQVSAGVDVYSLRQPVGVVAGITPFNFPAMVPMWMFANAIMCGNCFILKPSEKDPSAALFMADLLTQAGLPPGVFNVLQGDKVAVDRLLEHPQVKALSFVGSTPIAHYVYETGTAQGKRVQALGGAKNHMLVLADADVSAAADAAVSAAFGSAGERCMAISVIVAVGEVADQLIPALTERISAIVVGPGTDPDAEMGPLITRQHCDKVRSYLDGAAQAGAKVVVDGRELSVPGNGYFLGASLIDDVTAEMDLYIDEIFGPVLILMRVDTYEQGLDLINNNQYGNGTAIFTRDGGAARKFQSEVEVGMVGINVPIPVPIAAYSFGGWKSSLFGDLHMYGPDGIKFYTRNKVVTSRWPDPATSSVNLGFPVNN